MFVSFPLIAGHRAIAQAIATSGVSDLDDDLDPSGGPTGIGIRLMARVVAWRRPGPGSNPYLVPAPACPECGTRVVRASGCIGCPACGWGKCG